MDQNHASVINEVGRVVVRLSDDATIYGSATYVAIAFDASPGSPERSPSLLSRFPNGLGYQAQYELFYGLCADRAQKTVDGQLVADGRPISPEKYLCLWRQAIEHACSAGALFTDHGLRLVATLRAPLAAMSGKQSPWTSSPFADFEAFHAKHGRSMAVDAAGVFTLALDLRGRHAARDAYYGASMLSCALGHDSTDWQARITVHATRASTAHPALFQRTEFVEA